MNPLYPLKFKPVYKDYPWGNTRLPSLFGREAPEGIYAESWEVSTHPDGESVVANGELAEAGQKRQAMQATFLLNKPIG